MDSIEQPRVVAKAEGANIKNHVENRDGLCIFKKWLVQDGRETGFKPRRPDQDELRTKTTNAINLNEPAVGGRDIAPAFVCLTQNVSNTVVNPNVRTMTM